MDKKPICRRRGHGFDPWSGKIPHTAEQLSSWATAAEPVLWSLWATTTEPTCPNYWSPCTLEPMLFLYPNISYFPSVAYKDNANISTHTPKSQYSNLVKVMCRKSDILDRTSDFYVNILKRTQWGGQGDVPCTTAYKASFLPTILTIRREELFGFSF